MRRKWQQHGRGLQSHLYRIMWFRKVMTQIVPMLGKLNNGETCAELLEFVTENGKEILQVTWYKTRSIVLGLVSVKNDFDCS